MKTEMNLQNFMVLYNKLMFSLISSLIIFPALTSMRICKTFKKVIISSSAVGIVCIVVGIISSFLLDVPASACIVLINLTIGNPYLIPHINRPYLADSPEEIRKKVMGMYTDPNHIKVEDPGSTVDNPLFMFVDQLCSDEDVKKHFKFVLIFFKL